MKYTFGTIHFDRWEHIPAHLTCVCNAYARFPEFEYVFIDDSLNPKKTLSILFQFAGRIPIKYFYTNRRIEWETNIYQSEAALINFLFSDECSSGNYIIKSDTELLFPPDHVRTVFSQAESSDRCFSKTGVYLVHDEIKDLADELKMDYNRIHSVVQGSQHAHPVCGQISFLGLSKNAFREIGGFPVVYHWGDFDIEFQERAVRKGFQFNQNGSFNVHLPHRPFNRGYLQVADRKVEKPLIVRF